MRKRLQAALDDAYEDGTVAEAEYEERRARLRDRAVKLVMAQEDG